MTPPSHRPTRHRLAIGSGLTTLLCASFALASDATPIDRASEQVSEALTVLKDAKLEGRSANEHLEKARTFLARARAELLKAQAQAAPE